MDVGTHALASFALTRVSLRQAPAVSYIFVIAAGTIADLDALSALAGPSEYLRWHRTFTHSLLVSAVVSLALGLLCTLLTKKPAQTRVSHFALFSTILLAGWLHLAMDASQYAGVELFWPFSNRRIELDWLPNIDPWILAILVLAVAIPELLHLVSSEIGAKEKRPRGRTGAIIGLVALIFYVSARAVFHSDALAAIQARTYRGELPRRAAALPDSMSPFSWHGIIETESALRLLGINTWSGTSFDPESGVTLYKPEASPVLDEARESPAAQKFLSIARFPKAAVEKTVDGSKVQLRDLVYTAVADSRNELVVVVRIDANGKVTEDDLVFARDLRRR